MKIGFAIASVVVGILFFHTKAQPTTTPVTTTTTSTKATITTKATAASVSNYEGSCTFEHSTLCGWKQLTTDDFDWTLQSGPTLTVNTGPDQDHTLGTQQGTYLYIESSSPRSLGNYARLESHILPSGEKISLSFWYYMYGDGIGSLQVYVKDQMTHTEVNIFERTGDKGKGWHHAVVTVPAISIPNDCSLIIQADVGHGYHGDIAIDDIQLSSKACSGPTQMLCPSQVIQHELRDAEPQNIGNNGKYCYEFVPKNGSWIHAKLDCRRKGGYLVSIENDDQQNFVSCFLSQVQYRDELWLGLNDKINEEHWQWDSGALVSYTNWIPGRFIDQYHDQEDCAVIIPTRKGKWDDVDCNGITSGRIQSFPWICQYTIGTVQTQQPTTTDQPIRTKQPTTTELLTTKKQAMTTTGSTTYSTPTTTKLTTTTPQPVSTSSPLKTIPPVTRTCVVCSGPTVLCELLFAPTQCAPPNNYCVNRVINHKDGSRDVVRGCGNFDTCFRDWYLRSSDNDKCLKFEENNGQHLDFECTYCCVTDNCNTPLRPTDANLYTPV